MHISIINIKIIYFCFILIIFSNIIQGYSMTYGANFMELFNSNVTKIYCDFLYCLKRHCYYFN